MIANKVIEDFSKQIVEQFGAQQVILFGSYAYGTPTADSDVDLLIVMPYTGRSADESVKIRMALRPAFPVDLLIRTSEKIQERIQQGDTFLRDIMKNGKVLYAADHI
jgi:predicted nucleotidyltransferase